MLRRTILIITIVALCVGIPVFCEWFTTPGPGQKDIHMEMFRYGTTPTIIRANRGDELSITFETHDTGHSFLLQDYLIEAKVFPASEMIELRDPLDASKPFIDVPKLQFKAGGEKNWWEKLVSLSRFRCHVYCGRMHGFEQGDLIVRPNWLFVGSMGLLTAILIIACLRVRWGGDSVKPVPEPIDLNRKFPFLDKILKWRPLQFVCTLPVMAGFTLVVTAGFFGTKVGGRNFSVMMTWSVWMALLTLVLIPLAGRTWCLFCPLPSLGEYLQRGATVQVRKANKKGRYANRFFGLGLRWPKALRGPWIRMLIFLSMGTLSASMAGQPKWTASALFLLCLIAIFMSLIWELRAFCRYICPVATFISLYSPLGRVTVRSRDQEVCRNCKERTCLRGNEDGWACPYGLCVADIERNYDCGLCAECFKSCSYDNVSLGIRRGQWTEWFTNYGQAWQAIVMMVLGMVYPLTILSPWPVMRDMVNVVDKSTWAEFGRYALVLWSIALGIAPLIFWIAANLGMRLSQKTQNSNNNSGTNNALTSTKLFSAETGNIFKRTTPALIPLGLSFWATFFVATVMVNFTYIVLAISDPFGHGWDLLGTAGMPWVQIWPSGIPWIQAGLVLTGLIFSLKKGYQLWFNELNCKAAALRGFVPTAAVLTFLAAAMLVYFTNF